MLKVLSPRPQGTTLGLAAAEHRRSLKRSAQSPVKARARKAIRVLLATAAILIGTSGFTMGSAQAFIFDELGENIASTIINVCGPNDVPIPSTYTGFDTLAGLNDEAVAGARQTVRPDFEGTSWNHSENARERLQTVYSTKIHEGGETRAALIQPTYERYGFSSLRWHSYGFECFGATQLMGDLPNMALVGLVLVPMMLSMAVLKFVMTTDLYGAFGGLIDPFVGAMYDLLDPWIYLIAACGLLLTAVVSRFSLTAFLKALAWSVMVLAVFLMLGNSTSLVVTKVANFVTDLSGTAACKFSAANNGESTDGEASGCDPASPIGAVNNALWKGLPYQTWLVGQIGPNAAEHALKVDKKGDEVSWGAALLNANYVGPTYSTDGSIGVDNFGAEVISASRAWNQATYSPEGENSKMYLWTKEDYWAKVPFLSNVKLICGDMDTVGSGSRENGAHSRFMYSGSSGSSFCNASSAGTTAMLSHFQGNEYSQRLLIVGSGMFGVGAVALTIAVAALYLGYQKMTFFILLFLAPIVLAVASIGDRKRRPFGIRFAELMAANILKQVAAVCVVLFVSYSISNLFTDAAFLDIPWVLKPYAAILFFLALVFMAFPMKNIAKGAVKGDTSVIDKEANRPQRMAKTGAKVGAAAAGIAATGGVLAATGAAGGTAAVASKAATAGKAGTALGQAGRVLGHGSKVGRAMRGAGGVLKAGEGALNSKASSANKKAVLGKLGQSLIDDPNTGAKYRDENGQLRPEAQKMAMKDAKAMVDSGQQAKRAEKDQNEQLAQFFGGYQAHTGAQHGLDPEHPDNKRKAMAQKEMDRQQAREDASGRSTNGGPTNGEPTNGYRQPAPSGAPYPPERQHFRDQARDNLDTPSFARGMEYNTNRVRSGDAVLDDAGLTRSDVESAPPLLLFGDAYDGGNTVSMDPFHSATGPLNNLRFAIAQGTDDQVKAAYAKAADALHQHGVPDQISSVSSAGLKAEAFEPVQVLGAIPSITPETAWSERADAAQTMMGAQASMPADHPARESVESFTNALANPSVDAGLLDSVKAEAVRDLSDAMRQAMRQAMREGEGITHVPATAGAHAAEQATPTAQEMRDAVASGMRDTQQDATAYSSEPEGENDDTDEAPRTVYRHHKKPRRSSFFGDPNNDDFGDES